MADPEAPARPAEMSTRYDAASVEPRWAEEWIGRGWFHAEVPDDPSDAYCIVIPPPNVTGRLHIGHALGRSIEDILIRRARMRGLAALWVPGMDHAGIATQVVVERELQKDGIDRRELGRDAFVERVWAWKEQYGGEIIGQLERMGCSLDWDRERFTMDEGLVRAVRVAFVRWYERGLIYRGERLINWCPTDQTGLSDSEVEHEEVDGELVTFRYPLSDGSGSVEVATTRLETVLGDTGIAVHPSDDRYRDVVGRTVRHPFDGRDLPIVADEAVDPTFGTGAVKVTPAHDVIDFEIAQRTGLPPRNILDAEARVNANAAEEFFGLGRYDARQAVREALEKLGLLVREERPYRHAVAHCYRCHSEIEPWMSGLQWFVAVDGLKEPATKAAEDGSITFWPARWTKAYVSWLEGLRDWNISRQLWWGHRIPAWYCPDGHVTVAIEDPDACATCGSTEIQQDPDVLDTWFSSQLWPFSTLGWPDDTEDLRAFYPNAALVTGYEILYLWVARMIMSGISLAGDIPFRDVVIHGLIRDAHGRKMSKSLGNVIDPVEMIDRYGADAMRFSIVRLATGGQQDIPLSVDSIEGGRNFANKIWNAARLVLQTFPGGEPSLPPVDRLSAPQHWLLARHQRCVADVNGALDRFDFASAAQALYRFFWSEFCDWSLEMEKERLRSEDAREREDSANVLAWVLERTLRLLHPVMPFVTEEIWQRFGIGETIVRAPWPEAGEHEDHAALGAGAEAAWPFVEEFVSSVRRVRSQYRISPRAILPVVFLEGPAERPAYEATRGWFSAEVMRLAGVPAPASEPPGPQAKGFVRILIGGETALVFVGDLIDLDVERERVEGQLRTAREKVRVVSAKLGNQGFLSKAPAEVVASEKLKAEQLEREAVSLQEQLDELG
ncbi:MAG TPA: valine--tRNA ligase [Actinomycetota bacterium]|nr:valine--tRNA ligase [Actinomycetota bacterium]